MNYKFSLEKGSRKYFCPKCGDKHSLTRYIDTHTGKYLGDFIGRCDHEISCKYHKSPKQAGIDNVSPRSYYPAAQEKKKTSFISFDLFNSTLKFFSKNNFIKGLLSHFKPDIINTLIERYYIGTINDKVIFWQIDEKLRIRTGKIMSYDPLTLKRQGKPNWAHKHFKLNDFTLRQCLFGLHLINEVDPRTPICIVEAEKTAIIMSGYYPEVKWMAAGALQHLNKEKLSPLVKHKVYLYPDICAEKTWAKKTIGLSNINIVDWASALKVEAKGHESADLADFPHPNKRMPMPEA